MFGLICLICAVVIMVKVADAEDRSALGWGGATLVLCLAFSSMMPTLIGVFFGLMASFGSMFAMKLIQE